MWARMQFLSSGMIMIWSGTVENIPAGWVVCDGNNGTPNLTDRFIQGTNVTAYIGNTGGAQIHTHTVTDLGHTHAMDPGAAFIAAGGDYGAVTQSGSGNMDTADAEILPPYYVLVWIMKL